MQIERDEWGCADLADLVDTNAAEQLLRAGGQENSFTRHEAFDFRPLSERAPVTNAKSSPVTIDLLNERSNGVYLLREITLAETFPGGRIVGTATASVLLSPDLDEPGATAVVEGQRVAWTQGWIAFNGVPIPNMHADAAAPASVPVIDQTLGIHRVQYEDMLHAVVRYVVFDGPVHPGESPSVLPLQYVLPVINIGNAENEVLLVQDPASPTASWIPLDAPEGARSFMKSVLPQFDAGRTANTPASFSLADTTLCLRVTGESDYEALGGTTPHSVAAVPSDTADTRASKAFIGF